MNLKYYKKGVFHYVYGVHYEWYGNDTCKELALRYDSDTFFYHPKVDLYFQKLQEYLALLGVSNIKVALVKKSGYTLIQFWGNKLEKEVVAIILRSFQLKPALLKAQADLTLLFKTKYFANLKGAKVLKVVFRQLPLFLSEVTEAHLIRCKYFKGNNNGGFLNWLTQGIFDDILIKLK